MPIPWSLMVEEDIKFIPTNASVYKNLNWKNIVTLIINKKKMPSKLEKKLLILSLLLFQKFFTTRKSMGLF